MSGRPISILLRASLEIWRCGEGYCLAFFSSFLFNADGADGEDGSSYRYKGNTTCSVCVSVSLLPDLVSAVRPRSSIQSVVMGLLASL